jgi:hypothetical protein
MKTKNEEKREKRMNEEKYEEFVTTTVQHEDKPASKFHIIYLPNILRD